MTLDEFNQLLSGSGLPASEIARAAGLADNYIRRIRTGDRTLTDQTATRVRLAITRLKRAQRETEGDRDFRKPSESSVAAQYRLAVGFVAHVCQVKPASILSADPARRATADPAWMRAAQLRRFALYIANIYLNVPQAELARAAGMSKAAVSVAMNDMEDARDDVEMSQILAAVEGAFLA